MELGLLLLGGVAMFQFLASLSNSIPQYSGYNPHPRSFTPHPGGFIPHPSIHQTVWGYPALHVPFQQWKISTMPPEWTEVFVDAERSAIFGQDRIEARTGHHGHVSVAGPQRRSDGYSHGHGHSARGVACIVKGSYCQCHYCKCEHGHVHCSGYGKGGGYG